MADAAGSRSGSGANDLLALPRTPGWRMPLVLAMAGLAALLTYLTIDLARAVGWREAVLTAVTIALVVVGVWTRSRRWSLVALVLAITAGVLGFRFRADGDPGALHAGLSGMMQFSVAGMLLLVAGALVVTEFLHDRHRRRDW